MDGIVGQSEKLRPSDRVSARVSSVIVGAAILSFSADEIEVYAAKLILLHHWRRILSGKQQNNNIKETVD